MRGDLERYVCALRQAERRSPPMAAAVIGLLLCGHSALGQAPKITSMMHEGQEKTGGVLQGYTSGNVTEYTEGDCINFRFTLKTNDRMNPPAQFEGQMAVRFSLESAQCTFFDGSFTLGTHDGSAPAVEMISGTAPTIALVGTPFVDDDEYVQIIDITFPDPDSEARINYYLCLEQDIGTCMGSSQHSRLDDTDTPGDYMQTGAMNVPVPASMIVRIGACCFANGSCEDLIEDDCEAQGGDYQGDGSDCDPNPCAQPTGRCCFSDGSCQVLGEVECVDLSGDYQGDGSDCDPNPCPQPTGACCFTDGTCLQLTAALCQTFGGVYQGNFTDCDPNPCPQPTGACCFSDGSCQVLVAAGCSTAGGVYQGNFTDCDPNPCPQPQGACCLKGSCMDLTQAECLDLGGGFVGIGTSCESTWCPANDNCRAAIPVFNGSTPFSIVGATDDGPSPCGALGSDIWFHYTATGTGQVSFSTCPGADFDTVIAVYGNACACPAMEINLLACNDDLCGLQSEVVVDVCAGECYTIQLGGFAGVTGSGILEVSKLKQLGCGEGMAGVKGLEPGNCFNDHGPCLPFCEDVKCCSLVCASDPFCCDVTWDQGCADQAFDVCGQCGDDDAGNCYAANGSPGCNDFLCCQTVCEIDAFCCHVEWDEVCAQQAASLCFAPPVPCPGEGPCRFPHDSPGCQDQACCELVCAIDPHCCRTIWDQGCASLALQICYDESACPGFGECLVPHATPGCQDEKCCDVVCQGEPTCCTMQWDEDCVALAQELCGCAGDVDGDLVVDIKDLLGLLMDWDCTSPPGPCPGDVNKDGVTDVLDLKALIGNWGLCP
jgi:hypothetical protein